MKNLFKFYSRVLVAAWQFACLKLAETWSPQQIVGHQRAQHLPRLSHECNYQRIYADKCVGGTLHLPLRIHKQRRKRGSTVSLCCPAIKNAYPPLVASRRPCVDAYV